VRASLVCLVWCRLAVHTDATYRLVNADGDILGTTSGVSRAQQDQIVAAIMSNVFGEYERAGVECLGEPALQFLLFSFEVCCFARCRPHLFSNCLPTVHYVPHGGQDGVVGMVNVCKTYHLCAYADKDVNVGLLKSSVRRFAWLFV